MLKYSQVDRSKYKAWEQVHLKILVQGVSHKILLRAKEVTTDLYGIKNCLLAWLMF